MDSVIKGLSLLDACRGDLFLQAGSGKIYVNGVDPEHVPREVRERLGDLGWGWCYKGDGYFYYSVEPA